MREVLPSGVPSSAGQRRFALTVVLLSFAIFVAAVPFAKTPLVQVWAFIPVYEAALVVTDLITAVLLFGQYNFSRSRGMFLLASGYLFTAFIAFAHALTFPGLFSPTGWLGAGPQSTAWLYMFWHGGFPLFVTAYAFLKSETSESIASRAGTVVGGVAGALALACALTVLATAGQNTLPAIMDGNRYSTAMVVVVSVAWALSLLALAVLWLRRPHTVLDLWLMVVMCAWLFDIALSAVLNAGRFDFGFYAGRVYGLLATSFVLIVLLIENGKLYAQIRRLYLEREDHNRALEATVRERTEQLLQSEKLATMGALLAGVAHELNNPLAIVLGQTHMLKEVSADASVVERAEKINTAAGRCVRIVRNFLALARKRPPERTNVALNTVVSEAVELLAYEFRSDGIAVTTALAADLPRFSADGHQLHQVVVNLLANAHHAMRKAPAPKRVTLTTRLAASGERIQLEIADTGPGIPPEIRQKVFEPFFTTKPPGQGTGLGLSLCRGIIEQHGGTLTLADTSGPGSAFLIELPSTSAPAAAPAPTEQPAAPVPRKTILVVDDEEQVAGLITEMLQRDGHTTHVAANGEAALELLAQRSFDLVVSDTKMPVLDGIGLYAEITRRFPAMCGRMIFVTGDVLDQEKQDYLAATGAPVITKPFSLNDIRTAIRRRLSSLQGHRAGA